MKSGESVSLARLATLLEGDVAGAREVMALFRDELPRFEAALLAAKTPIDLGRALHRFRGSLLSMGLATMANHLAVLETTAMSASQLDGDVAKSVCALIPDLVRQTNDELS